MAHEGRPPFTVAVAMDDSEHSDYALQFYLQYLHRQENLLLVIHCVEPLNDIREAPCSEEYDDSLQTTVTDANKFREKVSAALASKQVTSRVVVVSSHRPGEAIVERALAEGVDLVVAGTRDRRNGRRSISSYVTDHAHCAVIVCQRD